MKTIYLDRITTFLKRVRPDLADTHPLEFKHSFGAVAGYVDGEIFISCGKFGIALKLPRVVLDDLFKEKDVQKLKYFPNGHIKKEYAVLPDRILENEGQIRELLDQSIHFVRK